MEDKVILTEPIRLNSLYIKGNRMDEEQIKQFGTLQINFNRRQVCVNEELIPMRRKEFAVLALLMEHPG